MTEEKKITLDDFKLSEEEEQHLASLDKPVLKAGYMSKLKRDFCKKHGIEYLSKKKQAEAKKEEDDEFTPKNAADIRREIKKYAHEIGYSSIKSMMDMVNEKDKKGEFVLNAGQRLAIHKELAKYEAPQYRSSDMDEENKSNVSVEIKQYSYEEGEYTEVLPEINDEEYDEFEFLEDDD